MSTEWHFLITLNEQLRPLKDPVAIQEVAVRLIGEHLHASRVNYAHIDGDEFVISRSYADRVPAFAGRGSVARWAALEHRKAEAELRANGERLAFLLRLNDAIRRLSDPAAIQDTAARQLSEHLGRRRIRGITRLSVVGDASNGFEAVAQAYTLRPDVILMDVSMPLMDGVEATRRIRSELPDIRILGVSMLARNETAAAIAHAGAAACFVKGTDTQRLIDHLLAFHASRDAGDHAVS